MKKIDIVIPAAGVGNRFGSAVKKQFYKILGKPVFYYTLKHLKESYPFNNFIIGCKKSNDEIFIRNLLDELKIDNFKIVEGGKERFNTVFNCLLVSDVEYVLIHDAVRPIVKKEVVEEIISKLNEYKGVICGLKVRDTVKIVEGDIVKETIDREKLLLSHTPQGFDRLKLIEALKFVLDKGLKITDEAQAFELLGEKVGYVPSYPENIKITYKEDVDYVETLLKGSREIGK
ncbi:2-C-methyl-D-erythritol 4-phosphate cytidylyltransferase [Deferribacter autotrophicus]|uniref:2-C-methyl-D-erythritol 4-phosphate cytidylyltransferase n=1 Tax=Deferribacter autotrophicus TaxID=500465 RepID=A0A5A8F6F6_9BACT|nr:2-C-methyl-D-erythritol 4-phosphate cytidylyltransferase [Deferribacter autotrophicus]KAA0259180.1 2-C-methyl-D-erythritol 4-phosphate cytidylyltransferase [Deferribacter autotrophicus]